MSRALVFGALLVVLGLVGIIFLFFFTPGDIRSAVKSHYPCTSRSEGIGSPTLVCTSSKNPVDTADDISNLISPADRRADATGIFLRYSRDMVAVTPRGRGAQIVVANERVGYRRFYNHVGGWWGRYTGPRGRYAGIGESFRGRGPGTGK